MLSSAGAAALVALPRVKPRSAIVSSIAAASPSREVALTTSRTAGWANAGGGWVDDGAASGAAGVSEKKRSRTIRRMVATSTRLTSEPFASRPKPEIGRV